jgi:hypothetical protein
VQEPGFGTQLVYHIDAKAVGGRLLQHERGAGFRRDGARQEPVYQETLTDGEIFGTEYGRESDDSVVGPAASRELFQGFVESLLLPTPAKALREKVEIEETGFLRGSDMRTARDQPL